MRLQIEVMEDEYEQRVADLKADLASLRQQLTEVNDQKKEDQKERSLLISTLTEQNQRLTSQLSTSTKAEVSLRKEIQELRDRFDDKRLTIRDQVTHLETLREEVSEPRIEVDDEASSHKAYIVGQLGAPLFLLL